MSSFIFCKYLYRYCYCIQDKYRIKKNKLYIFKKNLHSRTYERQWTQDKRRRNRGRDTFAKDRNRATEKGTLGQLIGVWGQRQGTNHVRQVTEDGRQGAEPCMRQGKEDGKQGCIWPKLGSLTDLHVSINRLYRVNCQANAAARKKLPTMMDDYCVGTMIQPEKIIYAAK